jgi:hypothetical protein
MKTDPDRDPGPGGIAVSCGEQEVLGGSNGSGGVVRGKDREVERSDFVTNRCIDVGVAFDEDIVTDPIKALHQPGELVRPQVFGQTG